ncbi:MAG: ester cyclase [Pseudomonadota bacterium]
MSDRQTELEKNKALVMRYINEVQQQHSLAAVAELYAEDFVDHSRIADGMFDGGLTQLTEGLFAFSRAFPDLEVTVNFILAEGNKVVVHKSFRGTQMGSWRGAEPTGKRVEWELVSIYGIRDGKIAEYWGVEASMKPLD